MSMEYLLYHVTFAGIAILLTQSLTAIWRANMFSLGHYGFYALGAYTSVCIAKCILRDGAWPIDTFSDRAEGFAVFCLCLAAGGVVAGGCGFLAASWFGKLRDDYFAVATLLLAELIRNVVSNLELTGGGLGYEMPYLFVKNSGDERLWYVSLFAVIAILLNAAVFYVAYKLENSRLGLSILAAKNNELAAEFAGIDVQRMRRVLFAYGTAVAGIAGALFLHFTTIVVPTDFSFTNGVPIILYVVLGRLSIVRCIVAACIMYAFYELLKLRFLGLLGDQIGNFASEGKELILAAVLILAVVGPIYFERWRLRMKQGGVADA